MDTILERQQQVLTMAMLCFAMGLALALASSLLVDAQADVPLPRVATTSSPALSDLELEAVRLLRSELSARPRVSGTPW